MEVINRKCTTTEIFKQANDTSIYNRTMIVWEKHTKILLLLCTLQTHQTKPHHDTTDNNPSINGTFYQKNSGYTYSYAE